MLKGQPSWVALIFTSLVGVYSSNLRNHGSPTDYMANPDVNEVAQKRHDLGVLKGEWLAMLYSNCTMRYNDSFYIADLVELKAQEKKEEAKLEAEDYENKISGATDADNVKDPTTQESPKMKWMDKRDDAESEARFYGQIVGNAEIVKRWAETGLTDTTLFKAEVREEFDDLEDKHGVKMTAQVDNATETYREALLLWDQWEGSSKDYSCMPVPTVSHNQTACEEGNTKFGIKCAITCIPGYDDPNDSKNTLRCRKEGKFGKQLYGEWKGIAACVGRMCGKPAPIEKSKHVIRMFRYPHVATYNCFEGYSQTGNAEDAKSFVVPCDETGNFAQNSSHVCQRIKCGPAPPVKATEEIPGTFYFSDTITYKCLPGHTLDETPGGLMSFSTTCQATGRFSQGQICQRVRCGPPQDYDDTSMKSAKDDKYFGDEVEYACDDGYSTDQKADGPKGFTLQCAADGDLKVKGSGTNTPIPQCRPVSAGMSPDVAHGNLKPREMFYRDAFVVTADVGYSTTAKPVVDDFAFVLSVTTAGTFAGLKQFKPISCGAPPSVENAKTSFSASEAVFENVLTYDCKDGYSTDKTPADGSRGFSIDCQADADFSKVPHLGHCANIDDCAEHTCGPEGECVDHLNNYTCSCNSGFEQIQDENTKELTCGNIDDCGPDACGVGECEDGLEDYTCICPTGFEQTGEAEEKTCTAKICGTPPVVEHAATEPVGEADEKQDYKEVVTYVCDIGYTLDGVAGGKNHFSIECKANEQFTDTKACKPIKCGPGPEVDNAIGSHSATFNETIRYRCADGYSVDGTPEGDKSFGITCLTEGQYSSVSKCRPVNCGEPDDVPASSRPAGSLVYKQSATYQCFEGYTLTGNRDADTSFKVKCHADGSLDSVKACLPKICGEPPKVLDAAHATTKDEGKVAYPRVTEITCRDGYTVDGNADGLNNFIVSCLSTGHFSDFNENECQSVRCGPLPAFPNAKLDYVTPTPQASSGVPANLNYEEKAFFNCNTGFSAGGEPDSPTFFKVECLPTGSFSAPPPDMQCRNVNDCEMHTCGPKGTCIDLIGPSPAYTCACEFGFEIMTQPNGEKSCGNTDDCKDVDCGVGTCVDKIGDYTCICPEGYSINVVEGHKTCVPVTCETSTPELDNGRQESSHSGAIVFPTTLRYKCDTGFSIDGSVVASAREFQVHCKPSAQLIGMNSCQKITCGTPSVLPFSKLITPATPRRSVEYDEKVQYECENGYTVGGKSDGATEFTVTCQDDGVLTDPEVCEPVKCGPAPSMSRSRAGIAGDVFFGMHLVYTCDLGYTRDGSALGTNKFSRDCKKDGSFSAAPHPCKPIAGGTAPVLSNAALAEYAGENMQGKPAPDVYYPNGLEYRCSAGFSENGSPSGATKITSRVNTLGQLSPALPSGCLPITFTIKGSVKNSMNGWALQGASVSVEGTSTVAQTSNGYFVLRGVRPGSITLVYKRSGYIQTTRPLVVNADINSGGPADIAMSPEMASDQWRAVVKWAARPTDLDTYAQWGWSKVCWYGRSRSSMGMRGTLEVDRTAGYGPETMYLTGVGSCSLGSYYCDIKYIINDYTRTGRMKDISNAEVTLYTGSRTVGSWKINNCRNSVSRDGNWWHVFTLDGKNNRLKWSCDQGGGYDVFLARKPHKGHGHHHLQNRSSLGEIASLSVNSTAPITHGENASSSVNSTAPITHGMVTVHGSHAQLPTLVQTQQHVHLRVRSSTKKRY